jgi:hypothetical protein
MRELEDEFAQDDEALADDKQEAPIEGDE